MQEGAGREEIAVSVSAASASAATATFVAESPSIPNAQFQGMRYLTRRPTIALAHRDDHDIAVTLPDGKVLEVIARAEDERFLVVEVDGQRFRIFEADLTDRGRAKPAEAS